MFPLFYSAQLQCNYSFANSSKVLQTCPSNVECFSFTYASKYYSGCAVWDQYQQYLCAFACTYCTQVNGTLESSINNVKTTYKDPYVCQPQPVSESTRNIATGIVLIVAALALVVVVAMMLCCVLQRGGSRRGL